LRVLAPCVVLLPINARNVLRERLLNIVSNMDEREAAELPHAVGASVLVPMHWDMFYFNRGSPGRLRREVANRFSELWVVLPAREKPVRIAL
jgi:L-ascorbate metabolism protein UlaG (beta-lactamase superfamily)